MRWHLPPKGGEMRWNLTPKGGGMDEMAFPPEGGEMRWRLSLKGERGTRWRLSLSEGEEDELAPPYGGGEKVETGSSLRREDSARAGGAPLPMRVGSSAWCTEEPCGRV